MQYLIIIIFLVSWFILDWIIIKKLKLPIKKWYKHESQFFLSLFLILIIVFAIGVLYFNANGTLVFPYLGASVSLLFGIEQYIYKRETKLHIHYFFDLLFWLALGILVYYLLS